MWVGSRVWERSERREREVRWRWVVVGGVRDNTDDMVDKCL